MYLEPESVIAPFGKLGSTVELAIFPKCSCGILFTASNAFGAVVSYIKNYVGCSKYLCIGISMYLVLVVASV